MDIRELARKAGIDVSDEAIEGLRSCSTAEEVRDYASGHGIELTEEAAELVMGCSGGKAEVSDEELANVSGGGCDGGNQRPIRLM